jgi:16S rRNA (cytidine1402-2'-O)-methyltransferase
MPGTLFVVATPIGNLEDITLRALRVLREVQLIAAEDTRRTAHLLARHAISTPTTSLHEHNEHRKIPQLIARLERGDDVALVSDAGTPTVSDPGAPFIRAARQSGIQVVPIPGPSAVLAALTASGATGNEFTFLGFPPTRSKARSLWFERLGHVTGIAVFFEAPHRIKKTLEDLQEKFGDIEVFVGREMTKTHETSVKSPISLIVRDLNEPLGEFTIVVEIGQQPEFMAGGAETEPSSRRQALAQVARDHGLTANQLYRAIEEAKKLVGRPT